MNKRYLIQRCSSVEEGQEVPPIPEYEALRILKDLEENPSLLDGNSYNVSKLFNSIVQLVVTKMCLARS